MSITQWLAEPDAGRPVSCSICGCRLVGTVEAQDWRHFPSAAAGQDARGCRPTCVDKSHDRSGRALKGAVPA